MKIFSLEVMLKQVIKKLHLMNETYQVTFTTYHTRLQSMNSQSNRKTISNPQSKSEMSWDDNKVESGLDKIFIFTIKQFPDLNIIAEKYEQYGMLKNKINFFSIQLGHDINKLSPSDILSPSSNSIMHFNMNEITDVRNVQRITIPYTEELYLKPDTDRPEKFEEIIKNQDEVSSYKEKRQIMKQITYQSISEEQIKFEIQQIRQDLKAESIKRRQNQRLTFFKVDKPQKQQQQEQNQDSIEMSSNTHRDQDDSHSLLNHLIKGLLTKQPKEILFLKLVSMMLIISINTIIFVNLALIIDNYNHLTTDSLNRMFPLSLFQDFNIFNIAIQNLDISNHESIIHSALLKERDLILDNLLNYAIIDYRNEMLDVFDYQMDRHDWIAKIEERIVAIKFMRTSSSEIEESQKFSLTYFLKDVLMHILQELAEQPIQNFNIYNYHESLLVLNTDIIVTELMVIKDLTNIEVTDRIDFIQVFLFEILAVGLVISFLIIALLILQITNVLNWRNCLVQTYFLFQHQDIEYYLNNTLKNAQDSIFEINEVKQKIAKDSIGQKKNILIDKIKRKEYVQLQKQEDTNQNEKFKRKFFAKMIIFLISLFLIGIIYFIPFTLYIQNQFEGQVQTNDIIKQLGFSNLRLSTKFFILMKKINIILDNKDITQLQHIDDFFANYLQEMEKSEQYITLNLPFEKNSILSSSSELDFLVNLQTNSICELLQEILYQDYLIEFYQNVISPDSIDFGNTTNCYSYLEGALDKGYKFYISKVYIYFQTWTNEIQDTQNEKLAINILTESEDLQAIFITFKLIIQFNSFLKWELKDMIKTASTQSVKITVIITALSVFVIIAVQVVFLKSIITNLKGKVTISSFFLRMLSFKMIQRNKHLNAFLMKNSSTDTQVN